MAGRVLRGEFCEESEGRVKGLPVRGRRERKGTGGVGLEGGAKQKELTRFFSTQTYDPEHLVQACLKYDLFEDAVQHALDLVRKVRTISPALPFFPNPN